MPPPPGPLRDALAEQYSIERELGRGGMAVVYLARDLENGQPVALKVLRPELPATLGPERFLREIRLAARLQHPHILPVLESGIAAGQLWFTMPYVEGETLRDQLRRESQLPLEHALRIAREIAEALHYAHKHGVIHRDIKPDNLLITKDGNTLLGDFGIAHALGGAEEPLTQTGLSLGTPTYMSPEQATGDRALDARSDIYSLGCVLYEMLAGEPPFTGATPQAILAKRLAQPPPRLGLVREVPPALERIVTRALARSPADRFANAAKFARALEQVAAARDRVTSVGPAGGADDASWGSRLGVDRSRLLARSVLVAAVLVAVLMLGYVLVRRDSPTRPDIITTSDLPPATGAPGPPPGPAATSIAVLPLANVGGDTANEYFADGMTDELAIALAKVPGLRVAARTSSFALKGKQPDPDEVGKKLRVGSFVTGSVRRAGNRLRLTAQLVNVADGLTVWSDTYERDLRVAGDVFQVQDDIARAIVAALRPALGGGTDRRLVLGGTASIEAHDLYLRGRFFFNKYSEPDLRRSLALYQQALARDSTYALAWAGVADAWALLADDWVAPRDAFPRARAAALKAMALDSMLPDAHLSLGYILLWFDGDVRGAEREFHTAMALKADPAVLYAQQFFLLLAKGQIDSALALRELTKALDPLAPFPPTDVGLALADVGAPDRAIRECEQAIRLAPDFGFASFCLGNALLAAGRPAEALEAYRRAAEVGDRARSGVALAHAASGHRAEALRVLHDLEQQSARRYVSPDVIAAIYVSLGDQDAAFEWLEKARVAKTAGLAIFIEHDRRWLPIRDDPRFATLLRKVRLPPDTVRTRPSRTG